MNQSSDLPSRAWWHSALVFLAVKLIRLYQLTLSPWIGQQCRFYPTCSHYASDAMKQHGVFIGSVLTVKRLAKCQPFHKGGIDDVPTPSTGLK